MKAGDVGGFTALTDVNDRDRSDTDRIPSGAFDQSIKRWQDSGERIPLYWEEIWSARHPIGSVDPATLRDVGGFGPFFDASIDLEGEHRAKAHDAWTAIKSNAVEVELDYLLLDNDEADGVRTLQEVDITGLTSRRHRKAGRRSARNAPRGTATSSGSARRSSFRRCSATTSTPTSKRGRQNRQSPSPPLLPTPS